MKGGCKRFKFLLYHVYCLLAKSNNEGKLELIVKNLTNNALLIAAMMPLATAELCNTGNAISYVSSNLEELIQPCGLKSCENFTRDKDSDIYSISQLQIREDDNINTMEAIRKETAEFIDKNLDLTGTEREAALAEWENPTSGVIPGGKTIEICSV